MDMDAALWERVQELFHEALDLPEPKRRAFLASACADRPELVAEVEALLEADAAAAPLLDHGLDEVADQLLDGSVPTVREIGPYRILSVLGHGGMGVVYLAERKDLGARAAIKVLRDASLSPARRRRFAAEQRTLARLEHPSIARIHDADTLPDGTPYFVMEYVDGVPLTAYCEAHDCSIPDRLRLFRAVCEAVQHAHRQAIIHRDLKPSNILVTADGGVKLLDFGIAKQLESVEVTADPTRTLLRLLTPAYAAPEQLRGEPVGVYTDVYALGVILYELLAGRRPYDLTGRTPGQAETMILESAPERPSAAAARNAGAASESRGPAGGIAEPAPGVAAGAPAGSAGSVAAGGGEAPHGAAGAGARPPACAPESAGAGGGEAPHGAAGAGAASGTAARAAGGAGAPGSVAGPSQATAGAGADSQEPGLTRAAPGTGRARRRRRVRGGDWADLDVLCLTAMHADPERRYRTVDALIADIDRYLAGEPLAARPDTLGYRARKFLLRNRRAVAAASVVALFGIGMTGLHITSLATARDAALAEAARAERMQRFMLNLFEGDDAAAGPADTLRVLTLLDRGVREARQLEGEPVVQAELFETLGTLYRRLGDLPRADSLLESSLTLRRAVLGEEHVDVARGRIALALLRADQARFDEAEALARAGLAASRRHLPSGHVEALRAATSLGEVLQATGAYEDAIAVLEEALRPSAASAAPDADRIAALYVLASSRFYSGDYATADSLNRILLDMSRQLHGERHPQVADNLINLGAVQYQFERYDEAEVYYRAALDIIESFHGPDHPMTAAALTGLARTLVGAQRYDDAVPLLERALAVSRAAYGDVHPRIASILNELGGMAYFQDRVDEAEAFYSEMAEIYRAVYEGPHMFLGVALSNLANVHLDRGANSAAEEVLREALEVFDAVIPAEHVNHGITRIKLGRALLSQGRFDEAAGYTRAGYDVIAAQEVPSAVWLRIARRDLVRIYDESDRPEDAARFRAELEAAGDAVTPGS